MNNVIHDFINEYEPLRISLNKQIKDNILHFNQCFSTEKAIFNNQEKYKCIDVLNKNIDLTILENKEHNFEIFSESSYTFYLKNFHFNNFFNSKIDTTIYFNLSPSKLLTFSKFSLSNISLLHNNEVSIKLKINISLFSDNNFYISYDFLLDQLQTNNMIKLCVDFNNDITNRKNTTLKLKRNIVDKSTYEDIIENENYNFLLPYIIKLNSLFSLYEFEPQIVNNFLLSDQDFTLEQKETFKLIYDIDLFDNLLSTNKFNNKTELLINNTNNQIKKNDNYNK